MRTTKIKSCILLVSIALTTSSCIKQIDLSQTGAKDTNDYNKPGYLYPFDMEVQNASAQIVIKTSNSVPAEVKAEIPPLKYNKSWLFMLTQDDCKQAAYSCTWAAINGRPLTNSYFYDTAHLAYQDYPPDTYTLGKTLGSTDGAGNEVRFAITTTLAPELSWMNAPTVVKPGYTRDFYRFYMKSGLIWNNVIEMLNYGTGIAFHDVEAADTKNPTLIQKHFAIAQDSIKKRLSGRECKVLAEPNGNKAYVTAAQQYEPIQTLTAQAGAVVLRPFETDGNLHKVLLERGFNDSPAHFKTVVSNECALPKEKRKAVYVGVHGTDAGWVNLLTWLNDTYGKDGDNSIWFPSQEEYYEYCYYRKHSVVSLERTDDNTLKLNVTLPSKAYFYYPSITVNVKGLTKKEIASLTANPAVTGLSYADYEEGVMINIDCRRFLLQHATHYVGVYEEKRNGYSKADATYFVKMLKESPEKTQLLNRISK